MSHPFEAEAERLREFLAEWEPRVEAAARRLKALESVLGAPPQPSLAPQPVPSATIGQ